MPSITPNLRLSITSRETNKPFLNWRLGIDGPDESNMIKLDRAWGDMKTMVDGAMAAVGHPYTAATAADMTDHDKSYVYVGNETGYTKGNWYYWDEDQSAWVSGGVYNATALQTDDTLTLAGEAADAKATGEAVGEIKTQTKELTKDVYGVYKELVVEHTFNVKAGKSMDKNAGKVDMDISAGQEYVYTVEDPSGVISSYGHYVNGSFVNWVNPNTEYTEVRNTDVVSMAVYLTSDRAIGTGQIVFKVYTIHRADLPLLETVSNHESVIYPQHITDADLEPGGFKSSGGKYDNTARIRLATPIRALKGQTLKFSIGPLYWNVSELSSPATTTGNNIIVISEWSSDVLYTIQNDCWIMMSFRNAASTAITLDDFADCAVGISAISSDVIYEIPDIKQSVAQAVSDVDSVKDTMYGMARGEANPIAYTTIQGNYIKHADGTSAASSGGVMDCTDYTEVSNYGTISYRRNISESGNPSSGIAFYNENKVYISGVQAAKNGSAVGYEAELHTAAVPDNAKYVRLSILADTETYGELELYGTAKIVHRIEVLEDANEYIAGQLLKYTISGNSIQLNDTEIPFAADAGDVIGFTPDGSSLADNQEVFIYVRYVGETNRENISSVRKGKERTLTLANGITAIAFYCAGVTPGAFTVEVIRKDKGIQKHITALETEVDGIVNGTAVVSPAERAEMTAKLMQMKRPVRSSGNLGVPPLMLLHFSDIHGDTTNIARIAGFADEYADYLDDVICTGDMVERTYAEDYRLMDVLPDALQVVGNHETNVGGDYHGLSESDTYTNYFARYISGWGAQYTSGKCYYYKDYTERNIRLIVLDYIHESAEQLEWFADALAGAITAGYTAVVCTHVSPQGLTSLDTPFNTKVLVEKWDSNRDYRYDLFSDDYPAAVDTYIQGGGKFACWLTGHTHFGLFAKLTNHPNQITIAVPNAGIAGSVGSSEAARVAGTRTQDCFHVVAIDDASSLVKVVRIGNDYTRWMEHPTVVCWDFENKAFAS